MSYQLELLLENPTQWITISTMLSDIQKKEIKPFVLLALKELEGNPDQRTSSLMNADKFAAVRSVVRFSPECIAELTTLFSSENIYEKIPEHLRIKPGLVSLQWKIDLSLYQANMNTKKAKKEHSKEVMRRDVNIILVMELTDGSNHTYRMSIDKFHEFRYIVANFLKNMIVLEKRKCMRKD